ncbi:hypothetical protein CUMW_235760 [Citrus unshiu]|uniref:Uncharacterized protein n=1 Tax=Citrus unshiu TaxID=55188 RepID=A0A2H5QJE0_CITUN|nr:hypothetical protein CUMW_235760 [Citrus unshiu]
MSKYPAEIYSATSMLAFLGSSSAIDINSTTHPASMPTMPCVQILWALLTIITVYANSAPTPILQSMALIPLLGN